MLKNPMVKMGLTMAIFFMLTACGARATATTLPATVIPTLALNHIPPGAFVSGEWTLEFKTNGTFSLSGPQSTDSGKYTSTGDRVVITTKNCGNVKGTYLWRFDGVSPMILKAVDDQCSDRLELITSTAWAIEPK
jgi:hypothetical protein